MVGKENADVNLTKIGSFGVSYIKVIIFYVYG